MISKEELKNCKRICDWLYYTRLNEYKSFRVSKLTLESGVEGVDIEIEKDDETGCTLSLDRLEDGETIQCKYDHHDDKRDINLKWCIDVDAFNKTELSRNVAYSLERDYGWIEGLEMLKNQKEG